MQGKITTIKADGTKKELDLIGPPILADLQKAVGGSIEIVPGFDELDSRPAVAFCNEEGKIRHMPFNALATKLWDQLVQTDDVLVGDVVILTGDTEFMEAI